MAGLGGCPYAKNATGNVCTENVVYTLHQLGIETGIDLEALTKVGKYIGDVVKKESQSIA